MPRSSGRGATRAVRVVRRILAIELAVALLAGVLLLLIGQLPKPVSAHTAIGMTWQQHKDELGSARSRETCSAGVCTQEFRSGWIYSTASGEARVVRIGEVGDTFQELGGVETLGPPITDEWESGGHRWQGFVRGGVFADGERDPILVGGRFWSSWLRYADERGGLGFPRSEPQRDRRGTDLQDFERGAIYLRDGRPVPTIADIAAVHRGTGGQFGPLGYPVRPEEAVGSGLVQQFDGGQIWWSPATGAVPMTDAFVRSYGEHGGPGGALGFPTDAARNVEGGSVQAFERGALYRTNADGAIRATTAGDIQARYEALGGADGELGLPVGEKTAISGGSYQLFSDGVLVWRAGTGVMRLDRASFDAWTASPERFGWPTKDGWSDDRGAHVAFEKAETIQRDGWLYSAEPVDSSTAVLICDSQCSGDSWVQQGARGAGFAQTITRAYGGGGYVAAAGSIGMGVTDGVANRTILLPEGRPGVVIVTLGGNDATRGVAQGEAIAAMDRLIEMLRKAYPNTPIVVDGVMSRSDAAHASRRAMDAAVVAEAGRLGLPAISVAGWVSQYAAPQGDNVHLTQAGHDRIAPYYAAALRAVLGR